MKYASMIPVGVVCAETGKPLKEVELPVKLYMTLRREARRLGKTFGEHVTEQVCEGLRLAKQSPGLLAAAIAAEAKGGAA